MEINIVQRFALFEKLLQNVFMILYMRKNGENIKEYRSGNVEFTDFMPT